VLVRLGALGFPPDPARASLTEAYAFTHHLLFLHNFGVAVPPFPVADVELDNTDVLEGLLLRFLAEGNTDIVAELVLVGIYAGQIGADLCALATSWLLQFVDPAGFVRGPGASAGIEDGSRTWAESYHTTLVVGTLLRTIGAERSDLVADVPLDEAEALGQALVACARYELPLAVTLLDGLAGGRAAARFAGAFEAGVSFIERQTSGARIGLWADEREFATRDGRDFEAEVAGPVDELCRAALDRLRAPAAIGIYS
jgi:hypothetical protein